MVKKENDLYFVDVDNLTIPYDKDRNYKDRSAEDYLPPYSHYKYKSIYEGIILEIHLVDHCNLGCMGCNHFSPIAKPWYITPEELRNSLQAAKDNIPNIKNLILLGGEPTLHPQLLELCHVAREVFPELSVGISIFSNGKDLSKIIEQADEFKKARVQFGLCNYPTYTNQSQTKEVIDLKIGQYCNTRLFMSESLINENGNENATFNFYNCSHHLMPCLTIDGYKLFACPFAAHSKHYFIKANKDIPITEDDYLDIRTIKGDLDIIQKFIFTPKPICAYCKHNTNLLMFRKSYRDLTEYNTSITDLYFSDYERYEQIMNPDKDYFFKCFIKEDNPAFKESDISDVILNKWKKRFGQGKVDIIIPYYNMPERQLVQLINTLTTQTIIEDCVIYLISDNSPDENMVFKILNNYPKLNCVFLKNLNRSGPGVARNKGLDNSYNDIVFMLDADDYFTSANSLEILYNSLANSNKSINYFRMYEDTNNAYIGLKTNFIVKRDLISDIRFPAFFFAEDYYFLQLLNSKQKPEDVVGHDNCDAVFDHLVLYGTNNNNKRLGVECEKFELPLFIGKWIASKELKLNNSDIKGLIKEINQFGLTSKNDYLKVLSFYILRDLYADKECLFTEEMIEPCYYLDLINGTINLSTSSSLIKNEYDLKLYLITNMNKFEENIFYKPALNYLLNHLS